MGPLAIATGSDASRQSIDAYNVGDGGLNLSAASNAAWVVPAVGEAGNCALRPGVCIPISMNFSTAGLSKGLHTALVTISDPNAADAPQTVTVTVQVGGAVPDRMTFHVLPGGSEEQVIKASNQLGIIPTTDSGGSWLSVPADGGGSFRFNYNYRVVARHIEGYPEGEYSGQLNVLNSRIGEENKLVPVTLKVTGGPILTADAQVLLRLAEGGAAYSTTITPGNRGGGSLQISELHPAAEGGDWLSAEVVSDGKAILIKVQPAGLTAGTYQGTLEIVSNAANSPYSLPVLLDVMSAGMPTLDYATFTNTASTEPDPVVAPGMLVKVRGTQITALEETVSTEVPYPTVLAGSQVFVNGVESAVFHVAADQIWFQVPYEAEPGPALVQVMRDGQPGNFVEVTVVERAPHLEPASVSPYANARLDGGAVAMPAAAGGTPAKVGDTLTIYLIGLGRTDPTLPTGAAPVEPVAEIPVPAYVSFGANLFTEGLVVEASKPQVVPGAPGRYAVQVVVPEGVTTGDRVALSVTVAGYASDRLFLAIQ